MVLLEAGIMTGAEQASRGPDARRRTVPVLRQALQDHDAAWQTAEAELTKPRYAVLRAVQQAPGIEHTAPPGAVVTSTSTTGGPAPRTSVRPALSSSRVTAAPPELVDDENRPRSANYRPRG
ncbi:hypothetical protein KIH74_14940 [Kineosporia sp. J2-2]|uniref:Uncharacterized protein n=1 Tax=Kineosporia corallincola TaxID=2835133 RepID=A0ABS5TGL5_9ACTN|nr:hypothetical protein [Kineosporia corallincola]MBT0770235.1 hypothetical protein [Kineosporia corallincola]